MRKLLQVYTDPATYKNVAYMLLSFPLGLFYFVFFITGMSLGLGLAVILIGLPILMFMFAAVKGLASFERKLAAGLLNAEMEPRRHADQGLNLFQRVFTRSTLAEGLFLMLRFPLGLASFVLTISLVALTLSLITAPLTYPYATVDAPGVGTVGTLAGALVASGLGVLIGLAALPIINLGAVAWRALAERMLNVGSDFDGQIIVPGHAYEDDDFFYDDDGYAKPKRDYSRTRPVGRAVTVPASPEASKAKRSPGLRDAFDDDYDDEPRHVAVPRPQPRREPEANDPPPSSLADRIQAALHEDHPDDNATRMDPIEDDIEDDIDDDGDDDNARGDQQARR